MHGRVLDGAWNGLKLSVLHGNVVKRVRVCHPRGDATTTPPFVDVPEEDHYWGSTLSINNDE